MTPPDASLSVLVLAGGEARRLGGNKAERSLGSRRLVDRVLAVAHDVSDDVMLLAGSRSIPSLPGDTGEAQVVRSLPDAAGAEGPLAGLLAGLTAARHAWSLLLPCDMPHASAHVVRTLLERTEQQGGADAVVVRAEGMRQPFHGLYHRRLVARLRVHLAGGGRSLMGFLEACDVDEVSLDDLGPDADGRFLVDVDTPAALAREREAIQVGGPTP